jgi:hypothetical protein
MIRKTGNQMTEWKKNQNNSEIYSNFEGYYPISRD